MLSKNPQAGVRPLLARMLLGGAVVTALALTVSTLPDRVVFAAEPAADTPAAAPPVEEKRARHMLFVDTGETDADAAAPADGTKRAVRTVVVRHGADGDVVGKPHVMTINGEEIELPDGAAIAREVQNAMPFFGLDEAELRAALADQGIKGKKADAVIDKLRAQRGEALRKQFAWSEDHAERTAALAEAHAKRAEKLAEAHAKRATAFAVAPCPPGEGQRVRIDTLRTNGDGAPHVRMIGCGGAEIAKEKQVEAMKKARDRMAAQKDGQGMSAEIRAQVVADLDKAIAELEASKGE